MTIAKDFKLNLEMHGLEVAVERAIQDLEQRINSRSQNCAKCGGTGVLRRIAFNDYDTCDACNGKGS